MYVCVGISSLLLQRAYFEGPHARCTCRRKIGLVFAQKEDWRSTRGTASHLNQDISAEKRHAVAELEYAKLVRFFGDLLLSIVNYLLLLLSKQLWPLGAAL